MVSLLVSFLKSIFGRKVTPVVTTPTPPPEPTGFNIEHDWPFPSPKPSNTDFLITQLIKGVVVEGDHVFYIWDGQKRRHIRTSKGNETVLARHIVWWMEGRKHPKTANGLTTNCGEPKCIKLSHLILKHSTAVYGPSRNKGPVKVVNPEPKHVVKKKPAPVKEKLEKGDRSKCITAKVYFATEREASQKAAILNSKEVRGNGRRVYPYDSVCPYCLGWHLTKIKPGRYQKASIKNSSY
jgi:hypothetical protein